VIVFTENLWTVGQTGESPFSNKNGQVWTEPKEHKGRDPFNQNFRKLRSKTQWIGSVQPEKFKKNWASFWGGSLFPVGPVWILVEWIAPKTSLSLITYYVFLEWSTCKLSFSTFNSKRTDAELLSFEIQGVSKPRTRSPKTTAKLI